jgi:hypothetical protein
MKVPLKDTPAQSAAGVKVLLGDAHAKFIDGDLQLSMPPQSLSIFLLD